MSLRTRASHGREPGTAGSMNGKGEAADLERMEKMNYTRLRDPGRLEKQELNRTVIRQRVEWRKHGRALRIHKRKAG